MKLRVMIAITTIDNLLNLKTFIII